jgi:hypothetical protein
VGDAPVVMTEISWAMAESDQISSEIAIAPLCEAEQPCKYAQYLKLAKHI